MLPYERKPHAYGMSVGETFRLPRAFNERPYDIEFCLYAPAADVCDQPIRDVETPSPTNIPQMCAHKPIYLRRCGGVRVY